MAALLDLATRLEMLAEVASEVRGETYSETVEQLENRFDRLSYVVADIAAQVAAALRARHAQEDTDNRDGGVVMDKDMARPSDQALAVPAKPASGLDASRCDPSRFERCIRFTPGFDRRDPNPSKNYGIGGVRMTFLLIGEAGAVQWMIGTDWFPKSARETARFEGALKPSAWDLGYHSPTPHYDGQSPMDCDLLPCGKCFYDGSGLNAELLIEGFITHGDEYVWQALEAYHAFVFEDCPWPFDGEGNLTAIAMEARQGRDGEAGSVEDDSAAIAQTTPKDSA